jgi:hypothetical protein
MRFHKSVLQWIHSFVIFLRKQQRQNTYPVWVERRTYNVHFRFVSCHWYLVRLIRILLTYWSRINCLSFENYVLTELDTWQTLWQRKNFILILRFLQLRFQTPSYFRTYVHKHSRWMSSVDNLRDILYTLPSLWQLHKPVHVTENYKHPLLSSNY